MSDTRWVLVDDNDSSITYSGPWFESSSGFTGGNWGAPYAGSEHGANGTASLSFAFTGTRLRVLGTSAVRNTSGIIDPTWHCLVDAAEMAPSAPWTSSINNWPLCESPAYTPGQHIFTLNTNSTQNTSLWFDQIRYQPLANMSSSLTSPTVIIEQSDPSIQYVSGGWQPLTTSAMVTVQAGSVMMTKFTGTKLTWVGWTPSGYPTGASQASYSIDGGPAIPFTVDGLPTGSATIYNLHLFETAEFSAGDHLLTVTYNGPSAPLTLDHLLVENGDIILPGSTGNSSSSGTSNTNQPSASPSKHTPIGVAVGGAVGGLAVLILSTLGVVLFLRWRKRKRALSSAISLQSPPMTGFPPPIAQVTPYGFGTSAHPVAPTDGSAPSVYSSQTNLTTGWSSSSGYTAIPPRRDVKVRGGQPPRIHQYDTTNAPATSSSSYSASSGDPFSSGDNLVHHKDSGIRLTTPELMPQPAEIIDVPPSYTPS